MFGWLRGGHHADAHEKVYGEGGAIDAHQHRASFTHELLAAAVGFAAMRRLHQHQREQGQEVGGGLAKELLAGFVAAEMVKWAETSGLEHLDLKDVHRQAIGQAHELHDRES